jgi:uncharacterized protein (TIGR02246 family)
MPVAMTLIITALLALVGCAAGPPAPLPATETAAVGRVAAEWLAAAARKDADAVAALYTPDALLMSPNRPVISGREGVRDWFAALPDFTRMATTLVEVEGRGDLAVTRSTFAMTLELPGRPAINERGKILQVLRRQPDGRWLIWRESFSSDTPRPAG